MEEVRQGCSLHPSLFNVYADEIMAEARIEKMKLKINSEEMNEINYADDNVVIAKTKAQMQDLIDLISSAGLKYGMKINASKTKITKFTKDDIKEV